MQKAKNDLIMCLIVFMSDEMYQSQRSVLKCTTASTGKGTVWLFYSIIFVPWTNGKCLFFFFLPVTVFFFFFTFDTKILFIIRIYLLTLFI